MLESEKNPVDAAQKWLAELRLANIKLRKQSALVFWPEIGRVDRLMVNGNCRKNVGHVNGNGYKILRVNGQMHQLHRLIYKAATALDIDDKEIDHINGDKLDNRICNLRAVSHGKNMQNQHKAHKNNELGVKGVSVAKNGKYRARIRVNGKLIEMSGFDDVASAETAYKNAALKYHTHNPSAKL